MKRELLNFIRTNNLGPFNKTKTLVKVKENAYRTKDAKLIHNKLLALLSKEFNFADTTNLFNYFEFTEDEREIKSRQDFFGEIKSEIDNSFIKNLGLPKKCWNPKYGIIVVTEDEKTFNELQKLSCPTKFLIGQDDLDLLDNYDIVQVIECENFSRALENLPQSVFLDSVDEAYLERYVILLSSWKNNIDVLKNNATNEEIKKLVDEIDELMILLDDGKGNVLKRENIETALEGINHEISQEIKKLTVSGESLFSMLSKSKMPDELNKIIQKAISNSGLAGNIFVKNIPVSLDEEELNSLIKKQNAQEHTEIAEKIKKRADKLIKLPDKLQELSDQLILFDFISGLSKLISRANSFPMQSNEFRMKDSLNLFLDKAQAISFYLDEKDRCSILTGANSGGKTTLIEHIVQLNSLMQLGLPVSGNISIPLFSEIYYFAKNKGSMNKGAFETLLMQMSGIKPGKRTLILADEIESVTEPGVAGTIVCATADYFIKQGCFLVIATHLGKEIQKSLPIGARVDGIEAKGLDEKFELIVDHNPILGRLANSTPELIIEKMANSHKTDYFVHLYDFLKKGK